MNGEQHANRTHPTDRHSSTGPHGRGALKAARTAVLDLTRVQPYVALCELITATRAIVDRRKGQARLAALERERLALDAAPLDTAPTKPAPRRKLIPTGRKVTHADYLNEPAVEARRREALTALERLDPACRSALSGEPAEEATK